MKTKSISSRPLKTVVVLILSFATISTAISQEGNWRKVSEQPTPRHDMGSCVLDGKIYSIGGMSHGYDPGSQTVFDLVTKYDPETAVWDTCQSLPEPRVGLFACAVNGKIYAFGGRRSFSTPNLKLVEIYDPETDEWTTGTSMPEGAAFAAGCMLDGKIYILGGLKYTGWLASKQVLCYDPTIDSWEILTEMGLARALFSAVAVNDVIYVFGGTDNSPERVFKDVEAYDPASNEWTAKTDMPSKRGSLAGVELNGRIWVMSGTEDMSTVQEEVHIYDPEMDSWSYAIEADKPLLGFWYPSVVTLNSKVYLFGGSGAPDFSDVPEVIEFDFPVVRSGSNTWLSSNDSLQVEFYEDGVLYIVPEGTAANKDSILKYQVKSVDGMAGQLTAIWLDEIPPGSYEIFGVASDERLDRGSSHFKVDIVDIPDTAFLNALLELGVDTDEDSLISYAEAELITLLAVTEKGISDLKGIEAFINLDSLFCFSNNLRSIDVSNNTALAILSCSDNKLDSIDVSNNTALTALDCSQNNLVSLDVSSNTELWGLLCWENEISTIDVSNNPELELFWPAFNQLTSLDVSNNAALSNFNCSGNLLGSLNVSANTALELLWCDDNKLTHLNLSNNTTLEDLSIGNIPSLFEVCVWEMPFPPSGVSLYRKGSPNVYFTTKCGALHLIAPDLVNGAESIKVYSSGDGMIYLVPQDTEKDIATIRELCLDSLLAVANTSVVMPLTGLENGEYWLYGQDSTGYICEPEEFSLTGSSVGIDHTSTDQFSIYPNPANSFLTIETVISDPYNIEITSLNGQLMYSGVLEGPTHQMDLSSFQKGVYFITMRSKDLVSMRKIIKL